MNFWLKLVLELLLLAGFIVLLLANGFLIHGHFVIRIFFSIAFSVSAVGTAAKIGEEIDQEVNKS